METPQPVEETALAAGPQAERKAGESMTKPLKGPYRLCGFTVLKAPSGVISHTPCWVCFYGCWGHFCGGFWELVWNVLTEYKHDEHLIM